MFHSLWRDDYSEISIITIILKSPNSVHKPKLSEEKKRAEAENRNPCRPHTSLMPYRSAKTAESEKGTLKGVEGVGYMPQFV